MMARGRPWLWVGLLLCAILGRDVSAQVLLPPLDPTGRSGRPPELEELRPLEPKAPPIVPPAGPPPELEEERRAPIIRVFVQEIRIVGNTVFSDEELATVTAPYVNRELTTEGLESLRRALTLYYVNRGYVTSGAIIPDQTVGDGIVTIQIIEGKLSRIDIEGTKNFRPWYFRSRIALAAGPPVNIQTLQERLQLFQQDPRFERLNAELRPGVARGESELLVKVTEESPYKLWLAFDNYQSPTVGAERGLATYSHQSLLGFGDVFTFTAGLSTGVDPLIDTYYSLPFTPYDTTLTGSYRRNDFEVVDDQFEGLGIESTSEIIGLTLQQPLYRTLNQQVTLSITGEHLFNKTFIFEGTPFSFIPGFQNGVANVSALRITPEWTYRTRDMVLAVRSRFSVGLDVLDATNNSGSVPDGQFFSWLGQAQGVKRWDRLRGLQLLGRFTTQLADDRLFPLEQFPVGGRFTVRGYRENTFVRDNAIMASLEARFPLLRHASGEDLLQIAPFLDYGSAWNSKNVPLGDPQARGFLASIGVGLRWSILPANRAEFEVYWGQQLNHINQGRGDENPFQDHGVHMQLVVQAF